MHSQTQQQRTVKMKKSLVKLQLKQRTRENQHRKYSSQTMFSPCFRRLLFFPLGRAAEFRLCACFCYVCVCVCFSCFSLCFWSVDGHFLASLSFLILQIYVRIAHFMFSSYFFFFRCAHHLKFDGRAVENYCWNLKQKC